MRPLAGGEFLQLGVQIARCRIDCVRGTDLANQLQLAVVDVDRDHRRAEAGGRGDDANADRAATEHGHRIAGGYAAAAHRVVAHRERLDERHFAQRELVRRVNRLPGHGDQLGHAALALHAERFVVAAAVEPLLSAGSAAAAGFVRMHEHILADAKFS